jgi:ankyrin repeat protein
MEKYRWHWQFVGVEVTDPNQRGAMGDTMLHFATELGALEDIEVLVASGANVNAVGDIGNTPLHSAALLGEAAAAEKLLHLGADPSAKNDFGQTPADVARLGDRHQLAQILAPRRPRHAKSGGKAGTGDRR